MIKNIYSSFATLVVVAVHSQNVKGIVTDQSGTAVENAYIFNINSQTHAHTNELGIFNIDKSNEGDVLTVSALGYKKKKKSSAKKRT